MRMRLLLLILGLTICAPVSAQTVRIKTILDSNLFETFDGKIIKLAGVDAPAINHPAPYMRDVAERAYLYARSVFLNRHFSIAPLLPKDTTKNYELVFMQKDYPLGPVDYNREYLLEGFGRFTGHVPDEFYAGYKEAENEAIEKKNGIWNYLPGDSTLALERQFSPEESAQLRSQDSLLFIKDAFKRKSDPAGRIASELIMAPLSGFAVAYVSLFASAGIGALGGSEGFGLFPYAILGAGLGYTAGSALFVYLVEHNDNPNVTFWGTLGYSFLGAGAGIGLACLFPYGTSQYVAFFAAPVISSIIYANYVVPEPQFGDFYPTAGKYNLNQRSYSHKDLYNSTILYNVNLINIAF
ncbi:MAG: thermonuclease family protein [Acidobacteriota bacterium]